MCIRDSYSTRLTKENAYHIIQEYDIVVDGCDNFATRYLINDICIEQKKPYVYGAICGFEGQVSVFNYGNQKKNYRDLYPDEEEMQRMPPPPKGVMGVTPAIVGSVEATEVLKIICDFGDAVSYTHLTLPTKRIVEISGVAVSLKKTT